VDLGFHYAVVLPYLGALLALAAAAEAALNGPRAPRLLKAALTALAVGWLVYMIPFATLDYSLAEVARNANEDLDFAIRLATAWAGGGGSLYLYTAMIAGALLYALRAAERPPRAFVLASALVVLVAFASALLNGAFDVYNEPPAGGFGLNPLLKSLWIIPHPLTTFGGYALLIAGALIVAGLGDRLRGMAVFTLGWALLTLGIMFGALWSYETFGWGGYWAWDPVEVSELAVWLSATAALHMVGPLAPLQRGMLVVALSSALFAPYVTRSGLSPLHSFAAADIGSVILLASGLAALAAGLKLVAEELASGSVRVPKDSRGRVDLAGASALAAGALLAVMAFFVYASLLVPGVLVALGKPASIPTMRQGVDFYHPVLYPLFTASIALLPGYFLAREIGEAGYKAFLAVTAFAAIITAAAVYKGTLTPLPGAPEKTNLQAGVGVAVASLTLAALALGAYKPLRQLLKGRRHAARDLALKVLHAGMLAAYIGVLISGTYAFNDTFFQTTVVYPDAPAEAGPATISLVDYSYSVHRGTVDLYDHMPPTSIVAASTWLGLSLLPHDIGLAVQEVKLAQAEVEANETLKQLTEVLARAAPEPLGNVTAEANATLALADVTTGARKILADEAPATITIVNATLLVGLAPVPDDQGGLAGAWVLAAIQAGEIVVYADGVEAPSFHSPLEVNLTQPLTVEAREYKLEVYSIRVYPGEDAGQILEPGKLVVSNPYVEIAKAKLVLGPGNLTIPVPTGPGYYLLVAVERGDLPDLARVLNSSLADLLANTTLLAQLVAPETGVLPMLPKAAPSGVSLDVTLRVEVPGWGESVEHARIRFEANGEAAGIHGLVAPAVIVRGGLSDVYISVHPPMVNGMYDRYHEPLIYYLNHAIRELPPGEALTLTAVMAAGYNVNFLSQADPTTAAVVVEQATVDLYLLAENASGRAVESAGVVVMVKAVPAVNLVWAGVAIMAAAGAALALMYAAAARR